MYLVSENACPNCGNEKIKKAQNNDPVYIITKDAIMAASIEDILNENDIPFLKKGLVGAGITSRIGFTKEIYEFFVPYSAYGKAKELLYNFFDKEGKEK
jgi:hypothetical protein